MYHHHPSPARNETYLWNAIRAHEWLKASNMTDNSGLYTDGFHVSNLKNGGSKCDTRDEMVYTYNQGVLLSALRGLADATENDEYIIEGLQLVDAVLMSEGSRGELVFDGVLTEKCDPGGYCSKCTLLLLAYTSLTLYRSKRADIQRYAPSLYSPRTRR
jgi:predicted alpha-1,6-mannanase (GH76 family)